MLYFGNGGSDFSLADVMGFGFLFLIGSAILMLVLYLPILFWLQRRFGIRLPGIVFPLMSGVVLNLPVFIVLGSLIGRKMVASESILFMLTFLITGLAFGAGFVLSQRKNPQSA
jgi:hypothetical protein